MRKKMKKITYRELLNMIEEETNPKVVYFEGTAYKWSGLSYLNYNSEYFDWLSEKISRIATDYGLANNLRISYEEEILDEKEKEYLSNLIKPFKKYVKYIAKGGTEVREKIRICYEDYDGGVARLYTKFFDLPTFKAGTMYKGMELNKAYTLEELGI